MRIFFVGLMLTLLLRSFAEAADLPALFIGTWIRAGSSNLTCKRDDWRGPASDERLISINGRELLDYESGCRILAVKVNRARAAKLRSRCHRTAHAQPAAGGARPEPPGGDHRQQGSHVETDRRAFACFSPVRSGGKQRTRLMPVTARGLRKPRFDLLPVYADIGGVVFEISR